MHCDGTMSLRTEAPVMQPQYSSVLTTCAYRCDPFVPGVLNANNSNSMCLYLPNCVFTRCKMSEYTGHVDTVGKSAGPIDY